MDQPTPVRDEWTKRASWMLLGVVLLHILFASIYSSITPYRSPGFTHGSLLPDIGFPDERAHANLIQLVRDDRPYPVLDPKDPQFDENYQAHQPPAYYWAVAQAMKVAGYQDIRREPAGRFARSINLLFGGLNLVGVGFLVYWLTGRRRQALTAAAIVALVPANLILSAAINNDVLLFALVTWCLGVLIWGLRTSSGWPMALGVGLLAGLAMLTKTTAILLLAPILLMGIHKEWRSRLPWLGLAAVIALVVVAPWWARNLAVYGEPLVTQRFAEAFPGSFDKHPFRSFMAGYGWFHRLVNFTIESSTGVFGYFDLHYPNLTLLEGFFWIVVFFASAGLLSVWYQGQKTELFALGVFTFLLCATYFRFNLDYFQPQARYLFPALPVVAWLMASGLRLIHWRWTLVWMALYAFVNAATIPWVAAEFEKRTDQSRWPAYVREDS